MPPLSAWLAISNVPASDTVTRKRSSFDSIVPLGMRDILAFLPLVWHNLMATRPTARLLSVATNVQPCVYARVM